MSSSFTEIAIKISFLLILFVSYRFLDFTAVFQPVFVKYRDENGDEALEKILLQISEKSINNDPHYSKRLETQHIDCKRILTNDKVYTQSLSGRNRIPFIANPNLDTSCKSIRKRVLPRGKYPKTLKNSAAYARVVFKDYEFLEKQIQVSYHPRNTFCFVIDSKADKKFKKLIRNLENCLPNVYVLTEEFPFDSSGHFMNSAHYNCMKHLVSIGSWTYMVLMQNHDVIGKSIFEISRILEILGGANDILIDWEAGRVDGTMKWDLETLRFWRNASEVNGTLVHAKGAVHGTLSRAAVKWMVDIVNPDVYFEQWNRGGYGIDEQWLATFQSNSFLKMPGHFTDQCLRETGERNDFVTRFAKWVPIGLSSTEAVGVCKSGKMRHRVCLLGIEDFPMVAKWPNLMFNKIIPNFDYSLVECTAELIHNRTFQISDHLEDYRLEEEYYRNMVNVLYHKHHKEEGYTLNCTPSYVPWEKRSFEF